MIILRDDARIARMRKLGQYLSLIGIVALLGGLVIAFVNPEKYFAYELLALMLGWLLSQAGIYLGHRYMRNPRPDQILDKEVRRVAKQGRLYHYLLPAPHVLLTPQGIIIFIAKFQSGHIVVDDDKWKQRGMGFRRLFGGEALGNPTREAQSMVGAIAKYLHKEAPGLEEVPIMPIIVFTSKGSQELEIGETSVPVLHYSKLRGFLRQQRGKKDQPVLAKADFDIIRHAFDQKARHLLEIVADEGAGETA